MMRAFTENTEKVLITISLSLAFIAAVFKTFHIQGGWFTILSFFVVNIALAIFYAFRLSKWQSIFLLVLLSLGLIQLFFKFNHYPQLLPFPLFNVALLLFPYFIIVSSEINKMEKTDKVFLYSISTSFFLYGILTLSPKQISYSIGFVFLLISTALIILYFFLRKNKEFFLDGFLKTVAVIGLGWLISNMDQLIFINQGLR